MTPIPEWLQHVLTAIAGGFLAWVATILKIKAENRATNATAQKTETEAGSEIVEQARAVVDMWKELGQQLQDKVKALECRVATLEADDQAKSARIRELEETNTAKDKRIRELEREVKRLQDEVKKLKEAQVITEGDK